MNVSLQLKPKLTYSNLRLIHYHLKMPQLHPIRNRIPMLRLLHQERPPSTNHLRPLLILLPECENIRFQLSRELTDFNSFSVSSALFFCVN